MNSRAAGPFGFRADSALARVSGAHGRTHDPGPSVRRQFCVQERNMKLIARSFRNRLLPALAPLCLAFCACSQPEPVAVRLYELNGPRLMEIQIQNLSRHGSCMG